MEDHSKPEMETIESVRHDRSQRCKAQLTVCEKLLSLSKSSSQAAIRKSSSVGVRGASTRDLRSMAGVPLTKTAHMQGL